MNEEEQAHERAMRLAQEAFVARQAGDERSALARYREALELERRAAETHILDNNCEPTRSILLRSAASLAIECAEPRQAERLAAQALAHDPPAELAKELREVMATAYSLLDCSLCGRAAEDLAAIGLVHDIDHAALAIVWVGHILNRWKALVTAPENHESSIRDLASLRSFLGTQPAATWSARGSSVQGFDGFCRAVSEVEEALDFATRVFATSETLISRRTWATATSEAHRRISTSWEKLRPSTRELHQVLFPDDWMPDEETTPAPMWPVSIPEGRRLAHLCVVLRHVAVSPRGMVRQALAAAGMSTQRLHEFDTLTDLFLWEPDPDTQLPPLNPARAKTPDAVDELFAEKITVAEIQVGCMAADERTRGQLLKVAAACPIVETHAEYSDKAVHLAANYGKFLAENLPDDELVERIVWRICDRVLAEAGAAMEPSGTTFRTLLDTARRKPLSALVSLLDTEYEVALGYAKAHVRRHTLSLGKAKKLSDRLSRFGCPRREIGRS